MQNYPLNDSITALAEVFGTIGIWCVTRTSLG